MALIDAKPPTFPVAQKDWSKRWGDEMAYLLRLALTKLGTVGKERVETLQILNVPDSPTGLPSGSVYRTIDGTLKVVL